MRTLFSIATLSLLLFAYTGLESGIDGEWVTTIMGPQGEFELTYTFEVDGEEVAGTAASNMGEIAIQNGKVDGNEFTFETTFNGNLISHECVLTEDDEIVMSISFGGQPAPDDLVLTRVVE